MLWCEGDNTRGHRMSIIDDRRGADHFVAESTAKTQQRRMTSPTAGWFDDPDALHRLRYFDGNGWTSHVTHFGPTPCSGCA